MHTSIVGTLTGRVRLLCFLAIACATCAFSNADAAQNKPPKISGTPPTTVALGSLYSFQPTASDPDTPKSRLRFSVINKPYWASFSGTTGRLTGKSSRAGRWGNIQIAVSDGRSYVRLPAFAITVGKSSQPSGGSNAAPTISGTPTKSVRVGSAYAFTPTAKDANGDKLTFSIQNRPSWATFSTSSGRLSGTPTSAQVGSYANVTIKVSDGKATATLPAFSIVVSETASGSATLSWTPPIQNTDGSALRDLSGYRIMYGTSSSALNKSINVANPGVSTYVVENLSPATYYFAVKSIASSGAESALSSVASKTVK
jgi:hypothetical protein